MTNINDILENLNNIILIVLVLAIVYGNPQLDRVD